MQVETKEAALAWAQQPEANGAMTLPAAQGTALRSLAAELQQKPKLLAAIIHAMRLVKPAPKDKTNTHHNYKYTSAEAIIEDAHDALAAAGIGVISFSRRVDGYERQGVERFSYLVKYLLFHESGEAILCETDWPICVEKGRPLDKAAAIADTTSYSYFLCRLLLMARVDPAAEMNVRDDNPAPAPAKAKRQAPAADAPRISPEQHAELVLLINAWGADGPTLLAGIMRKKRIRALQQLLAADFEGARQFLKGDAAKVYLAKVAEEGKPQAPTGAPPADPTPSSPPSTPAVPSSPASSTPSPAASSAASSKPRAPQSEPPNESEYHSAIRQLHGILASTKGHFDETSWKDAIEGTTMKGLSKMFREPTTPQEAIDIVAKGPAPLLTLAQVKEVIARLKL